MRSTKDKTIIKRIQRIFLGSLGLMIGGSMCKFLLFPDDINTYENRTAEQLPSISISGFFNAEYQNKMELALSDQLLFAEEAKQAYNNTESDLIYTVLHPFFEQYPNKYFHYNDILVYDSEYLMFEPKLLTDEVKEKMQVRAASINSLICTYPDIDFVVYYIEKDTDLNFETNQKTGLYDYLETIIDQKNCSLAKYSIDSFEEFSANFYHTDHHWNHIGSYRAYTHLCTVLGLENPIKAKEEYFIGEDMIGSKTSFAKNTRIWKDSVYGYRYNFPAMSILENGTPVEDYGHQNLTADTFVTAEQPLSYASIYGQDSGEIIFDTQRNEKDNILIIGESYDNAILKLLASHYNKTVSIDLRSYDYMMNQTFDFASYVNEHDIDTVLLIGNVDYFLNTKFNVE